MNDFNTLNDMPMGAPQGAPQMAPPTGMPGPGPMAPPSGGAPQGAPQMAPPTGVPGPGPMAPPPHEPLSRNKENGFGSPIQEFDPSVNMGAILYGPPSLELPPMGTPTGVPGPGPMTLPPLGGAPTGVPGPGPMGPPPGGTPGVPGPGPMGSSPEELPTAPPKMMPKPIREGIVGPSLPPMQLIKTRNGYGWIIGGDYSRVWTGTEFEKL